MPQQSLDYQTPPRAMSKRGRIGVAAAGFIGGIVLTPMAMFLAVISAGAGHGGYEFARLLFPYSMLLTLTTGDRITNPLIALALAQFPVYGVVLAGATRSKALRVGAIGIGALHLTAVIACFSGIIPNFS